MKNLNKIAVIGDKDFVLPFKTIGAETFDYSDSNKVKDVLRNLVAEENHAIILISEKIAADISETIDRYKMQAYPIILPIPNGLETIGFGMEKMNRNMEKVIGKTNSNKGR